ncbi:LamG domain-containing protein [Candidatus Poribacteria bacterium]|nr:LamG domain-containing protein [Candidatus Poribacteria bacterium]
MSTRPGKTTVTGNPVEIGRWGGGSFFVGIIDEAAIFNTVLSEDDLAIIVEHGLAKALGGLDVEPLDKLALTWGTLKGIR